MMETVIHVIESIYRQGIFLHASYLILIWILLLDRYAHGIILDAQLSKILQTTDHINELRAEVHNLHIEQQTQMKENYQLNHEIWQLTLQMNRLEEELENKQAPMNHN